MTQPQAMIYDTLRTPRGRGKANGSLHEVTPINLVTGLLHALMQRNPTLDPALIDDLVLGIVTPLGDQGGCLPRVAALKAGLNEQIAGVQLNRFCGSGLDSINQAAARVRSGFEDLILAGGVESMSRAPMGSDGGAWAMDPTTAIATDFVPQGISADLIATIEGFDRDEVDRFAAQSHARAARGWADEVFGRSVVTVRDQSGIPILDRDETIRPDTTPASLSKLKPSFAAMGAAGGFDAVALEKYHQLDRIEHVHHAGNSSGIVDGAALALIGTEEIGRKLGLTPRARIISAAVIGSEPTIMLTGPTPACRKALDRVGLTPQDIDLVEINEAFAAIPLKLMRDLGFDEEQTNVNGGAIAMGHPLGATGAIILGTLVDELERRDLRRGLATLCIGAGMGIATIVERC